MRYSVECLLLSSYITTRYSLWLFRKYSVTGSRGREIHRLYASVPVGCQIGGLMIHMGRLQNFFCLTIERQCDRSRGPKKLTGFPVDPPHDVITLLPDSELIGPAFRSVETKTMLDGDLWGTHAQTRITIIPSGNLWWTLLMSTILLNEWMTRGPGARRPACYRAVLVAAIHTHISDFYLSVKTPQSNDGLNSKFISAIGS
jgi:hypothetical protein